MDRSARRVLARPLHAVTAPETQFTVFGESLEYDTAHALEFIDISDDVRAVVARAGISFGQVAVFSTHTTAAIIVQELEPLLLNDMARVLSRLAPADDYYEHNDFSIRTVNMRENEPENGHSHCQHLALGASETIPVHDGELQLGRYQSIFFVELDRALRRTVFVQAFGMASTA